MTNPALAIQDCIEAFERLLGESLEETQRIAVANTLWQLLWPLLAERQRQHPPQAGQRFAPPPGQPLRPGAIPPVGHNPPPFV